MTWQLEADLAQANRAHDLLAELDPLCLSIFSTSVQALFATRLQAEDARRHIQTHLCVSIAIAELEERDWLDENARSFSPLRRGPFVILPKGHASNDGIVIRMEAGAGFGTGEHASTAGCLEALADLNESPQTVLDMGCGSAILAIAAARLWDCDVLAVDNDPLATAFACHQVEANGLAHRIQVIQAEGFSALGHHTFDLTTANILARPLIAMAPSMRSSTVILSGFLQTDSQDVLEAYRHEGYELIRTTKISNWVTFTLSRHTP